MEAKDSLISPELSLSNNLSIDIESGLLENEGNKAILVQKLKEFEINTLVPILAEIVTSIDKSDHSKLQKAASILQKASELNYAKEVLGVCDNIHQAYVYQRPEEVKNLICLLIEAVVEFKI